MSPRPPRELMSWALFIGDALESVLSPGDAIEVWRNGNGDLSCSAKRFQETILAVGLPNREDGGGTCCLAGD
jgi:hypothetical protein